MSVLGMHDMRTMKIFIHYDENIMTSYQTEDWINEIFGDRWISDEEVRDRLGYLKGYDVVVRVD